MNALALSGGAAKGSYQAGALTKLSELGVRFDAVSGVSAGALNASMVATDRLPRLAEIWEETRKDDIMKHRGWVGATARWLVFKIGLGGSILAFYNTDKLLELILRELEGKRVHIPFTVGVVDLASGRYFDKEFGEGHILSTEDCRMIHASTAVPVIFDPVRTAGGLFVDGGVRNITPLARLCRQNPDRIVIITTQPYRASREADTPKPMTWKDPDEIQSIDQVGQRTLDILLNEVFREDIQRFLTVNHLVRQAGDAELTTLRGRPLKYFEPVLIDPNEHLGDGMDYSLEAFRMRFQKGMEDAEGAWETSVNA